MDISHGNGRWRRTRVGWTASLLVLVTILISSCSAHFPITNDSMERARGRFDASALTASLERLENWHRRNGTGVVENLEGGASEAGIRALFEAIPVQPNEEMLLIWGRHNGQKGARPLIWYHDLLSAEDAVSEYSALMRNPLVRWDPGFVPVFQFQGEWYAAYCGGDGVNAGPVVHFDLTDGPQQTFTNLTTLLLTNARVFEEGAVVWDPEREAMVEDLQELSRIHLEVNPGSRFPYSVGPP